MILHTQPLKKKNFKITLKITGKTYYNGGVKMVLWFVNIIIHVFG